ncbi:MAG: hypothetical protein JXA91_03670 [Candidatus Thermoplasmatota archaeon]|nr:hypothetical protein [Candidatus Thermoplasmatota archaeon]
MGEKEITDYIWHWTNGNSKIFTRRNDVAEEAIKNGFVVLVKKTKHNIIRY